MPESEYRVYRRKSGMGHERIYVLHDEQGKPAAPTGLKKDQGQVQCATLDRIPFCMKRSGLEERYEVEL